MQDNHTLPFFQSYELDVEFFCNGLPPSYIITQFLCAHGLQFKKRQNRFRTVLDSAHGIGVSFLPTTSSPVPFTTSLDQASPVCKCLMP